MFSLTASVLVKKPDCYTFWNIRREMIKSMSQVEELHLLSFFFSNYVVTVFV